MSYFDDEAKVEQYVAMAEGHDGRMLVEILAGRLTAGATVLELGMGPGKDLALLAEAGLQPVGSDASAVFVRRYQEGGGRWPVVQLDACTLETDLCFDAIYSNKVLHLLSPDELSRSLRRQAAVVEPGGLLLHSLWRGQGEEEYDGMRVLLHDEASIDAALPEALERIDHGRYAEMEPDDSLWVLLRRKSRQPS